jgi:hypothetical protein
MFSFECKYSYMFFFPLNEKHARNLWYIVALAMDGSAATHQPLLQSSFSFFLKWTFSFLLVRLCVP